MPTYKINNILILLFSIVTFNVCYAKTTGFPEEFSDFFEDTEIRIWLTLGNEPGGVSFEAVGNYDSIKVVSTSAKQKLQEYLSKNLDEKYTKQLLEELTAGIKNDQECKPYDCKVSTDSTSPRYLYDFDKSEIKIFVSNLMIKNSEETNYASTYNQNNALINSSRFYSSTDFSGNTNVNFSNYTTLGLPYGYFTLDSDLTTSTNDSDLDGEVYRATYDLDFEGSRLQIGRVDDSVTYNSTDFLTQTAQYAGEVVLLASSDNLKLNKSRSDLTYTFFAPQAGQLEVYRDQRLIYVESVGPGSQSISYDELPQGIYDAFFVLKSGNNTLYEERVRIINTTLFSREKGEIDYVVGFGHFDRRQYYDFGFESNDDYDGYYLRSHFSSKILDNFVFGGGLTSDITSNYIQLGGMYIINEDATLGYSGGVFSDSESYHNISLTYAPFYLDFRYFDYDASNKYYRLSSQLYGQQAFLDTSLGSNISLLNGDGYLRIGYYESLQPSFVYFNYEDSFRKKYINAGWTTDFLTGDISINFDISDYEQNGVGRDKDIYASITWTKKFGESFSGQIGVFADEDGFTRNSNYLMHEAGGENWNTYSSVGATIYRDNNIVGEASSSGNYDNSSGAASYYVYADTDGGKSGTFTLSGTQILSSNGLDFEKESSTSYLSVEKVGSNSDLEVSITQNDEFSDYRVLKDRESIRRLESYDSYAFELSNDYTGEALDTNYYNFFALPGTLYGIDVKSQKVASILVSLQDLDGKQISIVKCIGEGCISINPVTEDGVYRLSYIEGQDYRILSNRGLCILEKRNKWYADGHCLPGLTSDINEISKYEYIIDEDVIEDPIIYLGQYDSTTEINDITTILDRIKVQYRAVSVNGYSHIYISQVGKLTKNQIKKLEDIGSYVLMRDSKDAVFTSI